jgi:hypothetical protein
MANLHDCQALRALAFDGAGTWVEGATAQRAVCRPAAFEVLPLPLAAVASTTTSSTLALVHD